ncbi:hypothetical protein HG530_004656 [Fusarium avenaceum]|nr:hypothetical protein HG530_004656 [Fusarium avenaceum]
MALGLAMEKSSCQVSLNDIDFSLGLAFDSSLEIVINKQRDIFRASIEHVDKVRKAFGQGTLNDKVVLKATSPKVIKLVLQTKHIINPLDRSSCLLRSGIQSLCLFPFATFISFTLAGREISVLQNLLNLQAKLDHTALQNVPQRCLFGIDPGDEFIENREIVNLVVVNHPLQPAAF